jgi:monoamine oxidase
MNMLQRRIAIVGGGLAGLYAGHLLEQQGTHDYVIFEARGVWGGRIASTLPVAGIPASARFDLGPTWFWPAYQRQLDALIDRLGLARFAQHRDGDMVVERTPEAAPVRTRGYALEPLSMRLVGGMSALTDTVRLGLTPGNLMLGHRVLQMRSDGLNVEVDAEDGQGGTVTYCVQHVLLAVPPRLAVALIGFAPALPDAVLRAWQGTATWMAPHARYVAVYNAPFWRAEGCSGEARSARGPLGEIHDASIPGGGFALSGFFGLPAHVRRGVSEEVLRAHCRAQCARLFGQRAAAPEADFIKDWAADPWTATSADQEGPAEHGSAPVARVVEGPWRGRLAGIASEWSPHFPGYVAGAIEAATLGVAPRLEQPS